MLILLTFYWAIKKGEFNSFENFHIFVFFLNRGENCPKKIHWPRPRKNKICYCKEIVCLKAACFHKLNTTSAVAAAVAPTVIDIYLL